MKKITSLNLLIVDDSEDDMGTWKRLVSLSPDLEAQILEAECGEEAFDCIQRQTIDCAIFDHKLPDISGLELIEKVASHYDGTLPFPVIILTGEGSEELAVHSLKIGASDYISKRHVDQNTLSMAIQNALQKHSLSKKIAEKREELEFFAARISHDLKSPLKRIEYYAEMINKKDVNSFDNKHDYASRIAEDSTFAVKFINDLLDYSRNTMRSDKNLKPVNLSSVVSRAIGNLEHKIQERGAHVDVDSLPEIEGCETSLVQLFQNLIENALKYNEKAKPYVRIEKKELSEGAFQIRVQDNGIGIEPKYLDSIFKPLRRLHTRDAYSGTGIGLSTCQLIVEQHKGRISAESDGKNGTMFVIELAA